MSLHKFNSQGKRNERKEQSWSPIPTRAFSDMRLSERHFRVLGVIASYDRFGKNCQGCYVNRDRLAQESRLNKTVASDAISDLRRWGYLVSERHPLNRPLSSIGLPIRRTKPKHQRQTRRL